MARSFEVAMGTGRRGAPPPTVRPDAAAAMADAGLHGQAADGDGR